MEKIISNLKFAAKNVFFHLNEFIAFFIAVFMIQVAFGVVGFSYVNNNAIDYKYAKEDDSYHIELRNLNSSQYYTFINDRRYSDRKNDKIHEVVDTTVRNEDSIDDTRFDVFIKFLGDDPIKNYKTFNSRYSKNLNENSDGLYSVEFSDIMSYHNNVGMNRLIFILSLGLLSAVSLFLMITLFGYRLNHFKLTYGIYLTFGANYKKLVSSSFWEMMLITFVTLIPSCVAALGFSLYIYRNTTFVFSLTVLVIIVVMSLLITTLSVLGPMKVLAWSSPINALQAEDNSNYVSSPGISSKRFFTGFPKRYIFGTFLRYRKYLIKLILCGVIFGVAYMGGIGFTRLYSEYLDYNRPAYTLSFSGINNYYDESMRDDILAIEGVIDVLKVEECTAMKANSHILLSSGDKTLFSDAFGYDVNGGRYAVTNSVSYRPLDEGMARYLAERYDIDGDISSCVDAVDTVVVSNGRYNQDVLKLEPGDEIYIATYISNDAAIDTIESGKEYLLQQLEHNRYSYRKYTVGAVINDMPTGAQTPVYLPAVDYSVISRDLPYYYKAEIYLSEDLSAAERTVVVEELREYAYSIGSVSVDQNVNVDIKKQTEKNYRDFIMVLSIIVLVIMPVLLMFAQILFYLKRDTEMYVLEAFGATEKEIRGLYMGDGVLIAVISGVLYTLLSLIVEYALNRIANMMFIHPGFDFTVPWLAFGTGLFITCLVSFLSSVIPYLSYQRKKKELLRSVAGEV